MIRPYYALHTPLGAPANKFAHMIRPYDRGHQRCIDTDDIRRPVQRTRIGRTGE